MRLSMMPFGLWVGVLAMAALIAAAPLASSTAISPRIDSSAVEECGALKKVAATLGLGHCDSSPDAPGHGSTENKKENKFNFIIEHETTTINENDSHDNVHNDVTSDNVDVGDAHEHNKRLLHVPYNTVDDAAGTVCTKETLKETPLHSIPLGNTDIGQSDDIAYASTRLRTRAPVLVGDMMSGSYSPKVRIGGSTGPRVDIEFRRRQIDAIAIDPSLEITSTRTNTENHITNTDDHSKTENVVYNNSNGANNKYPKPEMDNENSENSETSEASEDERVGVEVLTAIFESMDGEDIGEESDEIDAAKNAD